MIVKRLFPLMLLCAIASLGFAQTTTFTVRKPQAPSELLIGKWQYAGTELALALDSVLRQSQLDSNQVSGPTVAFYDYSATSYAPHELHLMQGGTGRDWAVTAQGIVSGSRKWTLSASQTRVVLHDRKARPNWNGLLPNAAYDIQQLTADSLWLRPTDNPTQLIKYKRLPASMD